MTYGIYCIQNLVNGKRYIGKSVNLELRLRQHKSALQGEVYCKATNKALWKSVKKYGYHNFHIGVIELLPEDDLRLSERELYWMDWYTSYDRDHGYNLIRQSCGIVRYSEEARKLHGQKMAQINRGKKRTEDQKERMRKSFTPERREKLSMLHTGVEFSEERKAKISASRLGIKFSEEHKKALSKAQTGLRRSSSHVLHAADGVRTYSYEQYTSDGETLLRVFERMSDAVAEGFIQNAITTVCKGDKRNFTHKGFHWKKIPFCGVDSRIGTKQDQVV